MAEGHACPSCTVGTHPAGMLFSCNWLHMRLRSIYNLTGNNESSLSVKAT